MTWRPRVFGAILVLAIALMILLAYANHTYNADRPDRFVLSAFFSLFAAAVWCVFATGLAIKPRS